MLQEIQVRGGVKKRPHLSWGCEFFFWNNSILMVEAIVKQLICVRTLIFNDYVIDFQNCTMYNHGKPFENFKVH